MNVTCVVPQGSILARWMHTLRDEKMQLFLRELRELTLVIDMPYVCYAKLTVSATTSPKPNEEDRVTATHITMYHNRVLEGL